MPRMAEQMAYGALMGARGNSGVILSQILGGISKVFITKGNAADAKSFVEGFAGGVDAAYKAVVKPQEGTILTVCREASEYVTKVYQDNFTIEELPEGLFRRRLSQPGADAGNFAGAKAGRCGGCRRKGPANHCRGYAGRLNRTDPILQRKPKRKRRWKTTIPNIIFILNRLPSNTAQN